MDSIDIGLVVAGAALVATPLVVLVAASFRALTWKPALALWAVSVAIAGALVAGVWLVAEGLTP